MQQRLKLMLMLGAVLALLATACGGQALEPEDSAGDAGATDGAAAGGTEGAGGSAAGGESLDGAEITVGSKDFDEQLILGHISKLALEDAGATVIDQINLGGTDATRGALTSGEIDHYWEYNGTAWISFFGNTDPIPDRIEQYEAVAEQELAEEGLHWLAPADFNNTYGIAFPTAAAEDLGNPQTLSDLGPLIENEPDKATLCVESEFPAREDGLPGMEETYGYEFPDGNVTTLDTGVVYNATANRDPCNFGEVFTTDGRVAALELTVLEDDEGFFPLYNPSPIFTDEAYSQYGEALEELFNPISEALTQDVMTQMNAQVSAEGQRPEEVAREFLESNGLIGG
jgi:osmoprotectant transport system substrate-binding protein